MRKYLVLEDDKSPSDVVILARVSDMESTASASFFVNPWGVYAAGTLKIQAEHDSYIAEIREAEPYSSNISKQ